MLVGERPRGAVVGTVMVGDDGHRGWLYYVAVAEGSRGTAVGRAMVAAGEDWLRLRGVAKVQLMIRPSNREVARFYEGLGYEETPRVVMARWIDRRAPRG